MARFNIARWQRQHPRAAARARKKAARARRRDPPTHTKRWHRMVTAIQRTGSAENPYAVATARLGERSFLHHSRPTPIGRLIVFILNALRNHELRLRALEGR
jgi:hypothetical protein